MNDGMRNRRFLTVFVLCLTSVLSVSAQYRGGSSYSSLYDSEVVAAFKEEVSYLSSARMEGRQPGSEGEKMAAEYVYARLKEYGVDMLTPPSGELFGISRQEGDTLTSRNVYGFLQGYDKDLKDRYVVIGARLDNLGTNLMTVDGRRVEQIYYGANGNASGLAMMMELAKMLSTNSILLRRSVIFIAFGASTQSYAGAWYFLNRAFADAPKIDAMINLDMVGTASNGLYAYTASNTDMNNIIKAVDAELQPVRPQVFAAEPYPSDHRAFYAAEIPSVLLTSGKYPEHNTYRDTASIIDYEMMERVLEYAYNLSMAIINTDDRPCFRAASETPVRVPAYDDVVSFNDCDAKPVFLNSSDPRQFLQKWVYQYLKYPQSAVQEGVQGKVLVDFIIEKDGKVSNVRVIKGVDGRLDAEALRVVEASPKWKAGRVNGNKVRTSMTLPIEFRLERKSDKRSFGIK